MTKSNGTKCKGTAPAERERISELLVATVRDSLEKNNMSVTEEGRNAILENLKPLIIDLADARVDVAKKEDALVKGLERSLIEQAKSGKMELLKMLSTAEKKEMLEKAARKEESKPEPTHNSIEMDQYPA